MRLILVAVSVFISSVAFADASKTLWPAGPVVESRDCVLMLISDRMGVRLEPAKPVPDVRVEGTFPLKEYQDSIEKFWGWRPDVVVNVFNPITSEIFMMADTTYYRPRGRSIFDSLAHELTHYIQFAYFNADFKDPTADMLESQAVDVQNWFRETHGHLVQGDDFHCPLP